MPKKILTAEIVIEARRRAKRGERISDLAKEFGVTPQGLGRAVYGETWTHLNVIEPPAEQLGTRVVNAILADEVVIEARRRAREGASRSSMAVEYGVSQGTLSRALTGEGYAHIDEVEPPLPKQSRRPPRYT